LQFNQGKRIKKRDKKAWQNQKSCFFTQNAVELRHGGLKMLQKYFETLTDTRIKGKAKHELLKILI